MLVKNPHHEIVLLHSGDLHLNGELTIPDKTNSLVIFCDGSLDGSHGRGDRYIADTLYNHGIGTFLFDLFTEEDKVIAGKFSLDPLTERLRIVTDYLYRNRTTSRLKIGYFGAGIGAACALRAAAEQPALIQALVSGNGRPDLVLDIAARVKTPTLLIAGTRDERMLRLNQKVFNVLNCVKDIEILPDTVRRFEEANTRTQVSKLATNWFSAYL